MLEVQVFGAVYRDLEASISDVKGQACGFARYTQVRTNRCRSIEEVPDVYLDFYGHELNRLCRHAYLYVLTDNGHLRITD